MADQKQPYPTPPASEREKLAKSSALSHQTEKPTPGRTAKRTALCLHASQRFSPALGNASAEPQVRASNPHQGERGRGEQAPSPACRGSQFQQALSGNRGECLPIQGESNGCVDLFGNVQQGLSEMQMTARRDSPKEKLTWVLTPTRATGRSPFQPPVQNPGVPKGPLFQLANSAVLLPVCKQSLSSSSCSHPKQKDSSNCRPGKETAVTTRQVFHLPAGPR